MPSTDHYLGVPIDESHDERRLRPLWESSIDAMGDEALEPIWFQSGDRDTGRLGEALERAKCAKCAKDT